MAEQKAWICTACGYVHQGDEAPELCPLCGATSDLFELQEETAEVKAPVKAWICTVCGYIHDGPEPPEACPVCGVGADLFEPHVVAEPEDDEPVSVSHLRHVVIAGAGIAGVSAAAAAREENPGARVTLLSKEPELPYYRLNLTRYLAGEVDEKALVLHPSSWYEDRKIELVLGAELCRIAPDKNQVGLRNGEELDFDQLILAVGSHAFVPPIMGVQRENVTTLRTKAEADFILEQCREGLHCVIIGGGILGLEAAGALAKRGLQVTVLEGYDWLLPQQLNEEAGRVLLRKVKEQGIEVWQRALTKELVGDQRVREVVLEEGRTLPAELVVVTTGVRSNSYIARQAGLDVHHGVVVDNHMRTSHPDIFAVGDVAEHHGVCYGIWGPAQYQGTIAGMNAVGGASEFGGIPRSNMLKVLGYDLFSIGRFTPKDGSDLAVEARDGDNYYFFLFHDTHLVGAILLGNTHLAAQVKTTIEHRRDCSKLVAHPPTVEQVLAFLKGEDS